MVETINHLANFVQRTERTEIDLYDSSLNNFPYERRTYLKPRPHFGRYGISEERLYTMHLATINCYIRR